MESLPPAGRDETLRGKVGLVVGASGGLGRRFALVLARSGVRVALAARQVETISPLADEIKALGLDVLAVSLDATARASVAKALEVIEGEWGVPQVLVNSAGTNIRKTLLDYSDEEFDRVIRVNLKGVFVASTEFARSLIERELPGRIINVSSIIGLKPIRSLGPYSASKAAVSMLTQAMAIEWAQNSINVNALLPGYIETDLTREFMNSPRGQEMLAGTPRARFGQPADLDGALRFLASFETDFVTGAMLTVDDGQHLSLR